MHALYLFRYLDVVGDYIFWSPSDGFLFHGRDVEAKDIFSVFIVSDCDGSIHNHVGNLCIGKFLLKWGPYESQGVMRCLGPLVLLAGESFTMIHHHVDDSNGAVYSFVVV